MRSESIAWPPTAQPTFSTSAAEPALANLLSIMQSVTPIRPVYDTVHMSMLLGIQNTGCKIAAYSIFFLIAAIIFGSCNDAIEIRGSFNLVLEENIHAVN